MEMAKKAETKTAKPRKLRAWTKEEVRILKTLAREKAKTSVIPRNLKRSVGATHQKSMPAWGDAGDGSKKEGSVR
jgi:hypothetical protein